MPGRASQQTVVANVLSGKTGVPGTVGAAFAPSNVALCKYWGKRNAELNVPMTSSLSISLGVYGTRTTITPAERDQILLNGDAVNPQHPFSQRLSSFLDLFRVPNQGYLVETENTVPTAAGLASSASGFAAAVMALDDLYGWELDPWQLSVLARLGSGSACRSIFHGFAQWDRGTRDDGMDSYAKRLPIDWPDLRVGMVVLNRGKKAVSSREAMNRTVDTSTLYRSWPAQVEADLNALRCALDQRDFRELGSVSERNALAMHATMLGAHPPILYWLPETVETIRRVQKLRDDGLNAYVTIDAGPNVKVLFLQSDEYSLTSEFPDMTVCDPFGGGDGCDCR